jgi:hypothetical protein
VTPEMEKAKTAAFLTPVDISLFKLRHGENPVPVINELVAKVAELTQRVQVLESYLIGDGK